MGPNPIGVIGSFSIKTSAENPVSDGLAYYVHADATSEFRGEWQSVNFSLSKSSFMCVFSMRNDAPKYPESGGDYRGLLEAKPHARRPLLGNIAFKGSFFDLPRHRYEYRGSFYCEIVEKNIFDQFREVIPPNNVSKLIERAMNK